MEEVIAVIGAGVIGSAIVRSLLKSEYEGKIVATRRSLDKLKELEGLGATITRNNKEAARCSDIIFICVKPNDVRLVLEEIANEVRGKLVISTAATVPIDFYKKMVPRARFVRTMPNIAVLVQESFTAYCCDEDVTPEDKQKIESVLSCMGVCREVEEKYMDAITGFSGSGPAFIATIIEGLLYAGLKVGLPRDLALYGAAQTVIGTAKLVVEGRKHPAEIRDMVTTPGGVTIEGIYELEGSEIRTALIRAVEKATEKCATIRSHIGK